MLVSFFSRYIWQGQCFQGNNNVIRFNDFFSVSRYLLFERIINRLIKPVFQISNLICNFGETRTVKNLSLEVQS